MKAYYHQVKTVLKIEFLWRTISRLVTLQVMVHILCWFVFIIYEISLVRFSYGKLEPYYVYALFYTLNITYFYTYVRILNLTFDRKKPNYLKGIFLWLLAVLIYLLVKKIADICLYSSARPHSSLTAMRTIIPAYLFRTGYFTILATFYWASGYINVFRKQAAEAERQQLVMAKDRAEINNAYLQQQISPHMLFNTLNFIYSDVYQGSPGAARSVLLLSDIIRFGLEAAGPDGKTALQEELKQIGQLVEINRFRFHHALALELETAGEFEKYRIIPMVLLTLTENIFKHGNLKDPGRPALIRIRVDDGGSLRYYSSNLKRAPSSFRQSKRLGMENIRLRLDFAYPGAYRLEIRDTEDNYELTLTIPL